jgi:hypothetical protein
VFIVASPRPLTGKTFLARLLANFIRADDRPVQAFDLDPGEGSLARYLPEAVSVADIGNTRAQMALFDRLVVNDGTAKVLDVGYTLFDRFFALIEEIGFIGEGGGHGVEPMILFPADAHPDSLRGYSEIRRILPDAVLVPVFNEAIARGRKFRDQYAITRAAAVPLQIPLLPPALKPLADESAAAFAEYHALLPAEAPQGPPAELCSWTRRTFLEFRELELRLLLEKLRASLSESLASH